MKHSQCNFMFPSIHQSFFYRAQVECVISGNKRKHFGKAVEFSP